MLSNTAKRIAAATLAGGALAVSPMVMPAAQAAPPAGCPAYAVQSTTTTTLTLSPAGPYAAARASPPPPSVTVDGTGAPADGGTVTFKYRNVTQTVDRLRRQRLGGASPPVPAAPRSPPASAASASTGSVANGTSADRVPVVAGVSATAGGGNGGNGNGNGGNIGGVSGNAGGGNSGIAGLAATGMDSQTELFGAAGCRHGRRRWAHPRWCVAAASRPDRYAALSGSGRRT